MVEILSEQTIDNPRRSTRDLRPVYLEDLGMVPALERLAHEAGKGMGFGVEFHRQGIDKRLLPVVELALFQIVQEALSDIALHAQAKQASMKISFSRTQLRWK